MTMPLLDALPIFRRELALREDAQAEELIPVDHRIGLDDLRDALEQVSIPPDVACKVTSAVSVPTIGIGAGPYCDGQVLVSYDAFGLNDTSVPSFARQYARLANAIVGATQAYIDEVKSGRFPQRPSNK